MLPGDLKKGMIYCLIYDLLLGQFRCPCCVFVCPCWLLPLHLCAREPIHPNLYESQNLIDAHLSRGVDEGSLPLGFCGWKKCAGKRGLGFSTAPFHVSEGEVGSGAGGEPF